MKHPVGEYGIPLNPYELSLPPSQLDLSIKRNLNNHHWLHSKALIGRTALGYTALHLARHQTVLPIDTHAYLHGRYEAPYASHRDIDDVVIFGLMNVVDEAFHNGELLRFGSANDAKYAQVTRSMYDRCVEEYTRLR